ncbi:MAG TPA: sortase [Candidatus Dormibacteraeota bacterium]|jgi:LPXTG-site transpeptidase (sortase) family protein
MLAATAVLAAPSGWLAIDGGIRFNPASGATHDWANSGSASPTYACPAGAVNLSGPGGIFNCGSPGAGSTPPIAPTLTPAAAADPSIITAVFVVDPISSDTTTTPLCPAGDPTIIAGGAKNGDALTSIGTFHGPVPAKDDLSNVYAVSHTRADTGHPEVYFAAERLVNNGDSHMDFEFLQSVVGVTAACAGTFTGNRTEGDLLVAVDFTAGGAVAGTSVYQWHCLADPAVQPPDGTVCNPAGASPPEHYELIAAPLFLTFLVNGADIPCGGWVCRDAISGNSTIVSTNDFLEGGVDLAGIPFAGCFNTFLPHTRTAQSFTSGLKDFAGPLAFRSCRDPAIASTSAPGGSAVAPGASATDSVNVGNGGAGPVPTGGVTFFLCAPAQTTASACPSGGAQVGSAKPLVAGSSTSDPTTATSSLGKYCWRTEYAPDPASIGVFAAATHTNATSECFTVAVSAPPGPGLPNTGMPVSPPQPAPLLPGAVLAVVLLAVAWRRSRAVTVLLIAGLVAGSSPSLPAPSVAPRLTTAAESVQLDRGLPRERSIAPPALDTVAPERLEPPAWRLVIASIGVDAPIEPVGLDAQHAMASPSSLATVGWFSQGPLPGQPGDAVIDGHYGLPSTPAVFRGLDRLRPGDTLQVIWPDGRQLQFRIATSTIVAANSPPPPDVFTRTGPARLTLITCAGAWEQSQRTYSERLIVTAELMS